MCSLQHGGGVASEKDLVQVEQLRTIKTLTGDTVNSGMGAFKLVLIKAGYCKNETFREMLAQVATALLGTSVQNIGRPKGRKRCCDEDG